MNPSWKEFLVNNGAEFEGETLVSFGNPDRERRIPQQGNILCDLSHTGLIRVYGDDAETFLQNQLSNDIKEVSETHSQLSSYNTHKGRMVSSLRVLKRGEDYYLELSSSLIELMLKKLRMFVMMSKVTLEDESSNLVHFGYTGPDSVGLLTDAIGKIPEEVNDCVQYKTLTITRLHGLCPRFEILGRLDDARSLWETLDVTAAPVGSESWRHLNIVAGIPVITEDSSTEWVPQMLNYDRIGGISFSKGCYPGQEVVARLNYLGKTKRRTYHLVAKTDQCPATLDEIIATDANGKSSEAGKVVNAVINPDGNVEMLAVLKSDTLEQTLSLNDAVIEVLDLPYSLED